MGLGYEENTSVVDTVTANSPIRNGFQISPFVSDQVGVVCFIAGPWRSFTAESTESSSPPSFGEFTMFASVPKRDVVHSQFWMCQRRKFIARQLTICV